MLISQFVDKYKNDYGISYHSIYTLIESGKLKENIHFRRSYRGIYKKTTVIENALLKYLNTGR